MWLSLFVIFIGAGCGALLRAGFNLLTVSASSVIPLGTLLANMVGCLGGLTTFSSFSAEVVSFLQRGEYAWALGTALLHLAGSLVLTFLGILTYQALK